MGLTPVKSNAGKAMNPPPPATEFSSPPAVAAKNKRMACGSVTLQCTCTRLDLLQLLDRALVLQIAGVQRFLGLDQHHVDLFGCAGKVLDTVRDDDELAGTDKLLALGAILANLHVQSAFDNQEHLVLVVVVMPHELTLHLCDFHVHVIHFPNDPLVEVVGEEGELLGDVHGAHRKSLAQASRERGPMKKFHLAMKMPTLAGILKVAIR